MSTRALAALILLLHVTAQCHAQVDTVKETMLTSSVKDLLATANGKLAESGTRTDIGDLVSQDVREAPGIVYVVTSEDILNAGCRDLEEALMLVPSFMQGRDVDDVVGFAIRGQWAHEGKCQYLLNGMPLNEASFGTYAMGMRFPLDNISRIEVITGPGSVIYGGFAAMGVVNIITKDMSDEKGVSFNTSASLVNGTATQKRMHLHGVSRVTKDTELSYSASLTMGQRFMGIEPLPGGTSIHLADSTRAQTLNGFFNIHKKNFRGQFFASDYNLQVSDMQYDIVMRTVMASAEQVIPVRKQTRVSITGLYRMQLPWFYGNGASTDLNRTNTVDQRTALGATLITQPLKWLGFTAGTQTYMDQFFLYVTAEGNNFAVNNTPE